MKHISLILVLALAACGSNDTKKSSDKCMTGKVTLAGTGDAYVGADVMVVTGGENPTLVGSGVSRADGSYEVELEGPTEDLVLISAVPGLGVVTNDPVRGRTQDVEIPSTTLNGIVSDERTGKALAGAKVVILSANVVIGQATSDADGKFKAVIAAKSNAVIDIQVLHPDYKVAGSERLLIKEPGKSLGVALTIAKAYVLSGVVMDENDKPVAGAMVTHRCSFDLSEDKKGKIVEAGYDHPSVKTDSKGHYELVVVPRGQFETVEATLKGYFSAKMESPVTEDRKQHFHITKGLLIEGVIEGESVPRSLYLQIWDPSVKDFSKVGFMAREGVIEFVVGADKEYRLESADEKWELEGSPVTVKPGKNVVVKVKAKK